MALPVASSSIRSRAGRASSIALSSRSSVALIGESDLDPRVAAISRVTVYTDIPDETLQNIMDISVDAYHKLVLIPTRNTWRKEDGSKKELEREVERTVERDIAQHIKKHVEASLGGTWHVVYGHSFAVYVTHQRRSFCHFQLDGANVVVWRHGG